MRLNKDVKDIIFNYEHQLRFLPTLKMIKHTYKCSQALAQKHYEGLCDLGVDEDIASDVYKQAMYDWYPFPRKWDLPHTKDQFPSHCKVRSRRWKHDHGAFFGFLEQCVIDIDEDDWAGFYWQQNPRPITFEDRVLERRIAVRMKHLAEREVAHTVRNGTMFMLATEAEAWRILDNFRPHLHNSQLRFN